MDGTGRGSRLATPAGRSRIARSAPATGCWRIPRSVRQGNGSDAQRVHQDGNGRRARAQQSALPAAQTHRVSPEQCQETQRQEVPDAVARFFDGNPVAGHLQDIAFAQHGRARHAGERRGQLAGQQLKWQRDLAADEGRFGEHEDQQE
jgi:hypothetical protein